MLATVTFCQHDHAAAMTLEQFYIRVHTSCCSRTHRTTSHAFRSFCRTCIINRMILNILWQVFAAIQTFFQFSMGDVTTYDDRSVQWQTSSYRIFSQLFQDFRHRTVQVDLYNITFTCLTQFYRNKFARIWIQFLNPDTFLIDFTFDVTVGRARYSQAYRTRSTVTRQTDDAYVMSKIFTSELRAQSNFVSFCQNFFFQFDVAECTAIFVSSSRQVIIEMSRSQLHCQ